MAYIGKIPAAAAITASDLDPAVITGQPALATSPADTDEFLISDAGVLKRLDASFIGGANTPAFHINKTDTNQSVSHNTTTHITFNNEILDTNNAFTSNTFTVPSGQGGSYFVYANVYVASASDYQYLTIRKNGTSTQLLNDTFYASSGADRNVLLSGIVSLSATDYIRVYFSQSSGSSVNVESTSDGRVTYFGGFKIIT